MNKKCAIILKEITTKINSKIKHKPNSLTTATVRKMTEVEVHVPRAFLKIDSSLADGVRGFAASVFQDITTC